MFSVRTIVRALGASAVTALIAAALPPGASSASGTGTLDISAIDPTCKPCDDFAQFASGGWRSRATIPPGHASWGNFDELAERNRQALHAILDDAANATGVRRGSDAQRLGTFYRACMGEAAIEQAGTAPIAPLLRAIDAIHGRADLVATIAALQSAGVNDGLEFSAEPDAKESARTVAAIGLGGTGLPDREFYLKDDERSVKIRGAYRSYVATQLANLGDDAGVAGKSADAILALETALAKAMPSRTELRDRAATYHPTALEALPSLANHVAWSAFFHAAGAPHFESLNVGVPAYVRAYDAEIADVPLDMWKAYLRYHVVDAFASALPKRFDDATFAFRSGVLYGVKEPLPRWQRCTSAADRLLPTALGKLYVARAFPPAAKDRATRMVDRLQAALHDDFASLEWMSPQTKERAREKLAALNKKIGYPDRWPSETGLVIREGTPYAGLVRAARRWHHAREIARIGKPTDRTRWSLTPATVNAYYDPANNEVVFPAGILQPPFFSAEADDAVNYGAIGAVIGHEMTHGFDEEGRKFDAQGNLSTWWTPHDVGAFEARAQCIAEQYDNLESLPGVHMNGALVRAEAVADLGGTSIAFRAFTQTPEYRRHRLVDGYTPEQRFFLAFAQVWRSVQTEDYTRRLAVIDAHPSDRLRVIGTLSNMPEFQSAFHCAATDKMVRNNRCQIW